MPIPPSLKFALLFFSIGLWLAACGPDNGGSTIGVAVGDVVDDPDAYYGSTVTVSGVVNEYFTPMMFTIEGGGEELLVVSTDSIAPAAGRSVQEPVHENDIVQVSGKIRKFQQAEIEDQFGIDFGTETFDFDGQPAIIARDASATLSSVIVTPSRRSVVRPPSETETITGLATIREGTDEELAGESVHLSGLRVTEVIGAQSFWAVEDQDSLFVVLVSGALDDDGPLKSEQTNQAWEVYGVLRELPPSTELAAEWDLSEDLVRRLRNESVYLHGIYATASGE